jgi:predicted Zn-dependent protease
VGTAWACAALVVLVGGRLGAVGPVDDRVDRTAVVQAVADRVRASLAIDGDVRVTIVERNPRIASVQPVPGQPRAFLLSIEEGFLATLSAQELEAVIAHEMGHVWIYTHHPYLQTERLANRIAMRHVAREELEQVYLKLWGAGAVKGSLTSFLGHAPAADGRVAAPSRAQVAQE